MAIAIFQKDPSAKLDYQVDWSDWLSGDSIASSTWTVPAGITLVTSSNTAQTTTIRLSGGTHGTDYECVNHIITASGQEDDRSLTIQVRQEEAGASSDATDRAQAISELSLLVQINVAPVLTETEIETILESCKRASTWTSATVYSPGDVIVPTVRNGHRYLVTTGGTSAGTEPTWPITEETSLTDSGVELVEEGPDYSNIYDIRRAAHECWALKARKATQFIDTEGVNMNQVYQHCVMERDRLASVCIG